MANCPHCKHGFTHANLSTVDLKHGKATYKGIAYECPSCSAAISVGVDFLALKADIAKAVVSKIRGGS